MMTEYHRKLEELERSKCLLNHIGVCGVTKGVYICYSECVPLFYIGQNVRALTDEACTCDWNLREYFFKMQENCYKDEIREVRLRHKMAEKKK